MQCNESECLYSWMVVDGCGWLWMFVDVYGMFMGGVSEATVDWHKEERPTV